MNVVIVGAGVGGTALLRALATMEKIRVVGVADRNLRAPGVALARELGVPVTDDFRALVRLPDVDVIVQATGEPAMDEEIARLKWPKASIVEGLTMNLLLGLVAEAEHLVEALQHRERELAVILNSTHDALVAVDRQGVVTLCNSAAERLIGLSKKQLLGRLAAEAIPGTRLHEVLRTGVPELNRKQHIGSVTVVSNRAPVRDHQGRIIGAVSVFRDITEVQSLAEEITEVKATQMMLEAIIHATQDAISVADAQGRVMMVNPAYTQLIGLTPDQVIGRPATVDIAEGESMQMQVLRTRRAVKGVRMKVGPKKRDVVVNVAPIIVDGELKGSVGVVHDVSEIVRLSEELDQVKQLVRHLTAKYTFADIVAHSPMMQQAVEQARRAAATPATVLLRGESGTGKELFAHAIHNASARQNGQFIRVNCAALADPLLESELFGYVEGAFTGARKGGHRGLFEEAEGGTVFLDEVGEMSAGLQAKVLRVLQEREIRRVGDNRAVPVDVRVIAATNVNLEEAVARGTFREDLYYRLSVVPILIPPLRHRREDIPRLVEAVIGRFNRDYGRGVEGVAPAALALLEDHHWSGNVRELENIIGRAMIAMGLHERVIEARALPTLGTDLRGRPQAEAAAARDAGPLRSLAEVVAGAERAALQAALAAAAGNKTEASRLLKVSPRTLYYKLARHGLS